MILAKNLVLTKLANGYNQRKSNYQKEERQKKQKNIYLFYY
jgi:hypothetical protein